MTKSDGIDSMVPGTSTTYTITASNGRPSTAANVSVRDPLPARRTPLTSTLFPYTTLFRSLSDSIASLAPGASVTYTVVAAIDPSATGSLANAVTVTAAIGRAHV